MLLHVIRCFGVVIRCFRVVSLLFHVIVELLPLLGPSVAHCYPAVSLLLGVTVAEKSCRFMPIDFR